MSDIKPPWGQSDDPWEDLNLFKEWVISKDFDEIDTSSILSIVELYGLCTEVFDSACPQQKQEDVDYFVDDPEGEYL